MAVLFTMALAPAGFCAGAASTTGYAGLVYSGNPYAAAQSGIFALFVSPNQRFNGEMLIGDHDANFSGQFDTNGAADIVVKITIDNSCYECDPPVIDIETKKLWNVHFQLSLDGSSINGGLQFRHGNFPDGTLSGKRSSFNRTNEVAAAGKFTFIVSGSGDPANITFPTGNGFGIITITPTGSVRLGGSLADKSGFLESTPLCDDGTFPVFASLYNDKGMIQGWAGLTNSADADLTGGVVWVKPDFARHTFFPAGFTNELAVVGSSYVRTNPVLNWTDGVVIFQGGGLSSPFTNAILLNAKNKVTNVSDNKLALKFQVSSGRFNGSVKEPVTGDRIPFAGVILQKENGGFGYFATQPLSGQVMLGPAGP